jgi:hypothetical protein
MKETIMSRFTPQQKAIGVNDKFGNTGIKKQQGTTRVIYDTLPLDGTRVFEFFKNSQNRPFPYSNTGSDGNKLGVGNTLIIERTYLTLVKATGDNVAVIDVVTDANIIAGELSVQIANSTVVKQIPIVSFLPQFNKSAMHTEYNNFEYDTQLVIPPLLEFVFNLKTGAYTPDEGLFLRLTVEGTGAIIAPRTTF